MDAITIYFFEYSFFSYSGLRRKLPPKERVKGQLIL